MSSTTESKKKKTGRDPKDPDVMVWLERERYVTLAYQLVQEDPTTKTWVKRRLFQQDTDEFRNDVMMSPIVKVRFAGVIYRPNPSDPEQVLPPSLKEFKRTYATIRELHQESAKQRFENHSLAGEIDLMPFLKKLLFFREAERANKDAQERFQLGQLDKRPPKFKLRKPSLAEYLRQHLRKLLVQGCYKPRNQETHAQRKKAREALRLQQQQQPLMTPQIVSMGGNW